MRPAVVGVVVVLVLASLVVGVLWSLAAWASSAPAPNLAWAYIPSGVPAGAPFTAWYLVEGTPVPGGTWVQLRVCGEDGACVHGARRELAGSANASLVTATRALKPGTYDVDLLLIRRDRFGVPRTVYRASGSVTYGR